MADRYLSSSKLSIELSRNLIAFFRSVTTNWERKSIYSSETMFTRGPHKIKITQKVRWRIVLQTSSARIITHKKSHTTSVQLLHLAQTPTVISITSHIKIRLAATSRGWVKHRSTKRSNWLPRHISEAGKSLEDKPVGRQLPRTRATHPSEAKSIHKGQTPEGHQMDKP